MTTYRVSCIVPGSTMYYAVSHMQNVPEVGSLAVPPPPVAVRVIFACCLPLDARTHALQTYHEKARDEMVQRFE